jgi:hypothetical protein
MTRAGLEYATNALMAPTLPGIANRARGAGQPRGSKSDM